MGLAAHHCCRIIGVRMEGKTSFLSVQNWWENQQFVEINTIIDRADASSNQTYFIKTQNPTARAGLPWIDNHVIVLKFCFYQPVQFI